MQWDTSKCTPVFFILEPAAIPQKVDSDSDKNNESDDDVDVLENIKKYFAPKGR